MGVGRREAGIESGTTLASAVFRRLRHEIVCGELDPGIRLRIRDLSDRYGVGAAPLREALSRLAALDFVSSTDQKGFRVAGVSFEGLLDITESRQAVESEAFRLSMQRGDDEWEASIVSAFHRFNKLSSGGSTIDFVGNLQWEALHKAFHQSLIAGCKLPTLLKIANDLYDQGRRYRSLMLKLDFANDDLLDSHRSLMDVALSRDLKAGVEMLRAHLWLTPKLIETALDGSHRLDRFKGASADQAIIRSIFQDTTTHNDRTSDATITTEKKSGG